MNQNILNIVSDSWYYQPDFVGTSKVVQIIILTDEEQLILSLQY